MSAAEDELAGESGDFGSGFESPHAITTANPHTADAVPRRDRAPVSGFMVDILMS
jgi:hypothetical protein